MTKAGFALHMKRSTVYACVRRVMKAVELKLEDTVQRAFRNAEENDRLALEFEQKFEIPGVIGVLDGSHIPICHKSTGRDDPFYNRKSFFSIVLSAIVNASGEFYKIDVGAGGRSNDAYIFQTSSIGPWFETPEARNCVVTGRQFLLADSAYGLRWYLMKSFDRRNVISEENQRGIDNVHKRISRKNTNAIVLHQYLYIAVCYR